MPLKRLALGQTGHLNSWCAETPLNDEGPA